MCICCCQTKKSIGVALLSLGIILLIVNLIPLTIFSSNTLNNRKSKARFIIFAIITAFNVCLALPTAFRKKARTLIYTFKV